MAVQENKGYPFLHNHWETKHRHMEMVQMVQVTMLRITLASSP